MRIYAIKTNVPYGEYVEIVCARDKRHARKICENMYKGDILEIKLIKPLRKAGRIFFGGSQE